MVFIDMCVICFVIAISLADMNDYEYGYRRKSVGSRDCVSLRFQSLAESNQNGVVYYWEKNLRVLR